MLEKQTHFHFYSIGYVLYPMVIEMKNQNIVAFSFVAHSATFWDT